MSEIHFHLENASSQFIVGLGLGLVLGFLGCCVLGFFAYRFLQKDIKAVVKELRESAKTARKNYELMLQESKDNLNAIIQEKDAKIQELQQKLGAMQVAKIADDINAKIQKNKKA